MSKAVTSTEIKDRFIELFNNGTLDFSDELQIFEVMCQRYKLMTITDYAKHSGKSYNGIKLIISEEKIPNIVIGGVQFVISGLC